MKTGEGLWQQIDQSRVIKVHTGLNGLKHISDAMYDIAVRTPLRAHAESALKKRKIDQNQYDTLIKMIDSDDRENLVLAEAILKEKHPVKKENLIHPLANQQKKKPHGNPIYSPRPQVSKRKRGGVY